MKLLGTFCYNPQAVFPIYFVMRVNKQPAASGYWKKQRPMTGVEAEWDPDNGRYKLTPATRRNWREMISAPILHSIPKKASRWKYRWESLL